MKVFEKKFRYFRGVSGQVTYTAESKNPVAVAMGWFGLVAFLVLVGFVMVSVLSSSAENLWLLIFIPIGFIALLAWGVFSIKFADRYFLRKGDTPHEEEHYYG